jgi:aspartyl-tRNA(Asn)/glutamyl-tRNA(Gln) amidotransferase subunit B
MFNPIIGLEVHVELRTRSKMFCGCPADHFGKNPNTQTCPVCLGLPGALPVPNQKAIEWTIMAGLALECTINLDSKFDRKHYFYPDLPKGYQISQYDEPLCIKGMIATTPGKIHINRVHLEEDTGKLQHVTLKGKKVSLVDFNRSGVPLVEIVTEADITSSDQALEYAKNLQQIIRFLKISDADMEKGSMRLEANISLKQSGRQGFPDYKVEVKNLNSFRFLKAAIDYEIERQTQILKKGETPVQETRGWSEKSHATVSQRSKETSKDYRYFPDPDIPPLKFSPDDIDRIRQSLPKLPPQYLREFTDTYNIRPDYVGYFLQTPEFAEWAAASFDLAKKQKVPVGKVANYLVNQQISPQDSNPSDILTRLTVELAKPAASHTDMDRWVSQSIAANPDLVDKFKKGKSEVIGVFIGDIMRRSHAQADPRQIRALLLKSLKS